MGFSSSASLIVGISMNKLFKEINETSQEFDEYDKFGVKTNKKFTVDMLIATQFNGKIITISNEKKSTGWIYDWYKSIEFDGESYVGDKYNNVNIEINHADHETTSLEQIIMGISVGKTSSSDNSNGDFMVSVDEDKTNKAIEIVKKELAEMFGYTGEIKLYLSNNLSY